jgi:hypothetical protein
VRDGGERNTTMTETVTVKGQIYNFNVQVPQFKSLGQATLHSTLDMCQLYAY